MANRFWVGGTGTWNNASTANWSATSGGASGASAPISADAVIFDALSGTGTCTVAAGAICASLTQGASNISVVFNIDMTIAGNLTLSAGTFDINNRIFTCTSGLSTAAAARTIAFGSTGVLRCTRATSGSALDIYNATIPAVITGTPVVELTGNPSSLIARNVRSNAISPINPITLRVKAGSDTINFLTGAGYQDIDFTGFSGTLANAAIRVYGSLTVSTGMTLSAGTNALSFVSTSGTYTHTFNGKSLDFPVTFNAPNSVHILSDALTVGSSRSLTLTSGLIKFQFGVTSSAGTFVIAGVPTVTLNSTVLGGTTTLLQTTGTVNASNAIIQDINATGGATWNAFTNDNNVDRGNNDGWNFISIAQSVFNRIMTSVFKSVIQ